ncbi:ABC transporter substrate-binding protein [Ammoniphilus sp. CFH 90114]|uniref:ABC transporter substrate-binding protein n=1 Tax=Ammoniphilus sp. CFH 90114 TaxID=2493665 RepID=UPI00100F43B5|nr:ABC transporter substrate-binding protein [Ammoniphilus sp. CFH 90114]RXT07911.1 ABC transporter substrate-binding protein [Ammoniphilus sp. CFH 90114]
MVKRISIFLLPFLLTIIYSTVQTKVTPQVDSNLRPVALSETGGSVTIALNSDIVSLDPAYAHDFSTMQVVCQVTEGLLKFDKYGRLVSNLASHWEMKNPTTYVYTIRRDVRFQDGSPMTVADVLFSLQRILDAKGGSYLSWMYRNVERIEQEGDWSIRVILKKPDALWKYTLATTGGHIISKSHFMRQEKDFGGSEKGVLGTGPFAFKKWEPGAQIVLGKNPYYWDTTGGPYLQEVIFQVVADEYTRLSGLRSGQISMSFGLPMTYLPLVKKLPSITIQSTPGYMSHFIAFNLNRKPFDEIWVRKAISLAFDYAAFQREIIGDYGILSKRIPLTETMLVENEAVWKPFLEQMDGNETNLNLAREYLSKSSVPAGFRTTILTDNQDVNIDAALLLKAAVKPLGILVEIEKVTGKELTLRTFSKERSYNMVVTQWSADFPDPLGNLYPIFHSSQTSEGGVNYANYVNPIMDELIEGALENTDEARRAEQMMSAYRIIAEELPWLVLSHPKQTMVTRTDLLGYELSPLWYWQAFTKEIVIRGQSNDPF